MRRLSLGLALALALHGAVLLRLMDVPRVVERKAPSLRVTFTPLLREHSASSEDAVEATVAAPQAKRAEPQRAAAHHVPNVPIHGGAALGERSSPFDEPARLGQAVDLRDVLTPSQQVLLDVIEAQQQHTDAALAANAGARQVVVLDGDETFEQKARAFVLGLDGRKVVEGRQPGALVLRRRADGGGLDYDSAQLAARIHEDGTVTFVEMPDVSVLPGPLLGNGRSHHVNSAGGDGTLAEVLRKSDITALPIVMGGTFDINAPLLRLAGEDPLLHEKSCFLDDTRTLREQMSRETRTRAHARALLALQRQLDDLLADDLIAAADKRRTIFALWADCARGEGDAARALIEQFVRQRLPPGSALAFNDAELAQLNANAPAHEQFSPYR